jgi:hypothetical protein
MKKSILGVVRYNPFMLEGRTIGPPQEEINTHQSNINDLQTNLNHKNELFIKHFPDLLLPMPDDKALTLQCQSGVEFKIKGEKYQQESLTDKKANLDNKISKVSAENLLQQSMYENAVTTVSTHIASKVKAADSLYFQILSIPQGEIVHTSIYDKVCKLGEIDKFDLLLNRTPDINDKSSKDRYPIDYATIYSFEYGIRALIKNGSKTDSAFIYSLHLDKPESAKLLTILAGELICYNEIFTRLKLDNQINELNLSNCQLSTEGIKQLSLALQDNSALRELNISKNHVNVESSSYLALFLKSNKNIAVLNLSYNGISEEAVSHIVNALEKHQGIKILNVANNELGEEGGIRLSSILEHNNSILALDASSNNLADTGSAYIIDRMIRNPSVLKVALEGNKITDALAEDIIECIPQNKRLIAFNLRNNNFSSNENQKVQTTVAQTLLDNAFGLAEDSSCLEDSYSMQLLAENVPEDMF